MNELHTNSTPNEVLIQQLENLPDDILDQPRFFAVNENKAPLTKGWSNPENQKHYTEIEGYKGFDTAGHDVYEDYLFLDFDHIFTDAGQFVNALAEDWFNMVVDALKTYCELSASLKGAHVIAVPTAGKFPKVASGKNGRIYFDDEKKSFVEIFYGTGGRYCFFTGNVYRCEPKAPVAHGQLVDDVFKTLLDEVATQNKKPQKSTQQKHTAPPVYQSTNSPDFDIYRAEKMLEVIRVADLSREDWLNVGMALKNNGNTCADWEQWSRPDERFKDGECDRLWQGFNGSGLTIATIHDLAKQYGYDEKEIQREWYQLHPEFSNKKSHDHRADSNPIDLEHTGNSFTHDDDNTGNTPDETFIWTKDKIKSCPVNLRVPEDFIFSQGGMYQIVETKTKTKYIPVTKTPIVPTKIFYDPIKKIDVYEIAILSRGKWRHVEVDARTLGDARALNMLCDYGALILDNGRLKVFLAEIIALNPDLQEIQAYSKTGWVDDDCTTFAYPSADQNIIIRREGYDYERILKPKGDPDAWKKKFIEVTEQGGAIAHAIIGGACASCLIRPLDLPNLQIHLEGKKSIGKTPLVQFAASIFGDPTIRGLTRTFAATPKSRLEFSTAFCDLPFILDELESLKKKKADELPEDIYNFSLGIGGQALTRRGTKREEKLFNNTRITTGEHSIVKRSDNGGALKRVLPLRCATLLEEQFASSLYTFCKRNHGLFGETWIKYATKEKDLIEQQFHLLRDTVKANQKIFNRETDDTQLTTLCISLVAYQHFKHSTGIQSLITDKAAMNAELRSDIDAIIAQLPLATEIDDTTRAVDFLKDFFAGHEKFFKNEVNKPDFDNEFTQTAQVCYGKRFKNGEVAFLRTALIQILEKEGGFTSGEKLIDEFYDKGYLRHAKGTKTFSTYFNGTTRAMIRFVTGIIDNADEFADTPQTAEN